MSYRNAPGTPDQLSVTRESSPRAVRIGAVAGGPVQACNALFTFRRPPDIVVPVRPGR